MLNLSDRETVVTGSKNLKHCKLPFFSKFVRDLKPKWKFKRTLWKEKPGNFFTDFYFCGFE